MKTRYCHNVFDKQAIREYTDAMLTEAMDFYGIRWRKKGFDSNHIHINLDMGLLSKPEIAKRLKGFSSPRIFKAFSMASKPTLSKPRILEPCNRWANRRHELLRQLHRRTEIRDQTPIKARPVHLKRAPRARRASMPPVLNEEPQRHRDSPGVGARN